jgi:hypothetical protein
VNKTKNTNKPNRGMQKLTKALANVNMNKIKMLGRNFNKKISTATKYSTSIVNPEYMLKAQIPRQYGLYTLPINRHLTVPITANAAGLFFLGFQPYFMVDTTTNLTTLFVNNDVLYNGAGALGAGALGQTLPMSITPGTVQSYSLVSASLIIQPQNNWTTITGKLGGCVFPFNPNLTAIGAAAYNIPAIQTTSNMQDMPHYCEADLQASESLRFIYTITDVHDLEKYTPDYVGDSNFAVAQETTFFAYCNGAPANAKFNLEIYLNFEITVASGSSFSGLSTPCTSMEDPGAVHTSILNCKPDMIVTVLKGGIARSMATTIVQDKLGALPSAHMLNDIRRIESMGIMNKNAFFAKNKHFTKLKDETWDQHQLELDDAFPHGQQTFNPY